MASRRERIRKAQAGERLHAEARGQERRVAAISELRTRTEQPRAVFDEHALEELAGSIRKVGLINPISIGEDGVILAGERRYRAAKMAGLTEVPVIVFRDRDAWQVALAENIHRADLHPLEEAHAYQQYLEVEGINQAELAQRLDKSEGYISNMLGLLRLSAALQETWLSEPKDRSKEQVFELLRRAGEDAEKQNALWGKGAITGIAPTSARRERKPWTARQAVRQIGKFREQMLRIEVTGMRAKTRTQLIAEAEEVLVTVDKLLRRLRG